MKILLLSISMIFLFSLTQNIFPEENPISDSISYGDEKALVAAIKSGVKVKIYYEDLQKTPLILAIDSEKPNLVKVLLDAKAKANPNLTFS